MNLKHIFDKQRILDKKIIGNNNLQGKDLVPEKLTALQVEISELMNEWRGFKFWSDDQEIRKDKSLEEYADCLSFFVTIGIDLNINEHQSFGETGGNRNPLLVFALINERVAKAFWHDENDEETQLLICWSIAFDSFLWLGKLLGFTWEQIEQAYMDKNAVNHARQDNGY